MNPYTGEYPEPDEHLLEQEDELAEADADRQWMPDTDTGAGMTLPDPGVTTPPTDEQRRIRDLAQQMRDMPSSLWTGSEVAAMIRVAIADDSRALDWGWSK